MDKSWKDILFMGGICFLVLIFFYKTILFGQIPAPIDDLVGLYSPWRDFYSVNYPRGIPFKNFLITDPIRQQIPWRKIAIDQMKLGQLPGWNPYNFSGTPLLANIQAAALYPLNILFLVLPFIAGWAVLIVLTPLFGGVFMYLYLKKMNFSLLVCALGAMAWSFSGFNISWLTWGTIDHVALWTPLALYSVHGLIEEKVNKFRKRNTIFAFLVIVLSLCMMILAGHIQVALYCFLLVFGYAIYVYVSQKHKEKGKIITPLLAFVVALIISSIVLIPLVRNFLHSSRSAESLLTLKEGWFIPYQHLVQFIVPDYFGNPATLNYWGTWNYGELVGYISILPILFALYGLAFLYKRKEVLFWIIVLVGSLLCSLPNPLAYLPFSLKIPLLSTLQPTRLMVLIDFSLVMLACYGIDEWRKTNSRNIVYILLTLVIGLGSLWIIVLLAGSSIFGVSTEHLLVAKRNLIIPSVIMLAVSMLIVLRQLNKKVNVSVIVALFLLITVADLFRQGWKFTPFVSAEYFFPPTGVISFLEHQEKPFRVLSVSKELFPPNTASYFGIESIEGYDPVYSSRYEKYFAALSRGKPDISPPYGFNRILTTENVNSPLARLLNVVYIVSTDDIEDETLSLVYKEGSIRIYEMPDSIRRAYMVYEVIQKNTDQDIINALYTLSPFNEAVVEEPISLTPREFDTHDYVKTVKYTDNAMELSVNTSVDRFLVVSNSFDKGWHATVDGREVPIHRANFISLGIVVPAGPHAVKLEYKIL